MSKLPPLGPRIDKRALPFGPPPVKERKALGTRGGLNTYTTLAPVNRDRRARLTGESFGPHTDWVKTLPCCACCPEHYYEGGQLRTGLKPFLLERDPEDPAQRISDPHHTRTRGRQASKKCAPLCRPHHNEADGIDSGYLTFCETYGIDLDELAEMLWRVSPYQEE